MKEIKIKQFDINEVDEITLLSIEETNSIDKKILDCGEWWWLRSPGYYPLNAAIVYQDGSIYEFGYYACIDFINVRPAFKINTLESKIGESVRIGKTWCTVVNTDLVLADCPICKHEFDSKSNEWETSELKKFINSEEFISLL